MALPLPTLTLAALTVIIIGLIATIAMSPLWRGWRFGPIAVVSAITVTVLAIDVATGARLQVSALMGVQPMVGGRFYGFNNQSFALFATTSLLLAGALANTLVVAGKRRLAAVTVALLGTAAILLNGMPSLGADFGGPPALFPAFALLTLWAAGIRITVKRVIGVLLAAVAVVSSFAVVDWLRPEEDRTHLGRFVDTVLDGGLLDVVGRKLAANFSTFTNPLALVAITAILVLLIVLGRPVRLAAKDSGQLAPYHWLTGGVPLKQIATDTPLFLPTVYAVYVALAIGTAVNDSGVVIVAIGLAVLVPLLIATYARWILSITTRIKQAGLTTPLIGQRAKNSSARYRGSWTDTDATKGALMPASTSNESDNPSIKNPDLYDDLRDQGASKEKAARISNAAARDGHSTISTRGGSSGSYEDWTVTELHNRAKELGMSGYSRMRKAELIDALRNH